MAKRNQTFRSSNDVKAMNELLIHKLSKASEGYNYIESMKQIFGINKKVPSLSCLNPGGLGLRSSSLKLIDRGTF